MVTSGGVKVFSSGTGGSLVISFVTPDINLITQSSLIFSCHIRATFSESDCIAAFVLGISIMTWRREVRVF